MNNKNFDIHDKIDTKVSLFAFNKLNLNTKKYDDTLPLVHYSDPILKTKLEPYNFKSTDENYLNPIKIADILMHSGEEYNGVGISANQLGLPYRVFAMRADPTFICFNPEITGILDSKLDTMEEGCLTYPNFVVKVKRFNGIRVKFQDPYGNIVIKKFFGMTARVFQHEMMHMDGKTFKNYCSTLIMQRAIEKCNKTNKTNYKLSDF